MDIELLNVYNAHPLEIRYRLKKDDPKDEQVYRLSKLTKKTNKPWLVSEYQFKYLIGYLERYELEEIFLKKLMLVVDVTYESYDPSNPTEDLKEKLESFLSIFDYDKMIEYLKSCNLYVPEVHKVYYDNNRTTDGNGSRTQTYTREDYIELGAFVTIMKATIPISGIFMLNFNSQVSTELLPYLCFNMYKKLDIFKTPAGLKLSGYFEKMIESSDEPEGQRIIRQFLPANATGDWLFGVSLLSVLYFYPLGEKIPKNIVPMLYARTGSKLGARQTTAGRITEKRPMKSGESESEESKVESYRFTTDFSIGDLETVEAGVLNIHNCMEDIDPKSKKNLDEGMRLASKFGADNYPVEEILNIVTIITGRVFPPEAITRVRLKTIQTLMALAYAYLKTNNHKELSLLVMTVKEPKQEEEEEFQTLGYKISKISDQVAKDLEIYYPNKSITTMEESRHIEPRTFIVKVIDDLVTDFFMNTTLRYIVPRSILGNRNLIVKVHPEIKTLLGRLYLELAKNIETKPVTNDEIMSLRRRYE